MSRDPDGPETVPFWVRVLLLLYPEDFREARGVQVADFVGHELREARSALSRGIRIATLATDMIRGAVRMRRRRWRTERNRRRKGWTMGLWSEVRQAGRGLVRSPGFVAVVVLTLGIGIGLNTAVFSVVNGVLLKPLPYDSDGRLVYVQARREAEGSTDALVSGGDWRMLRQGVPVLSTLEAVAMVRQTLVGAGLPRQVQVGWVSPGFLDMLGVRPVAGRLMSAADPPGTAVLSHRLWTRDYSADPTVIGRTLRLDGHTYTIVGVLPAGFRLELPLRGGRLPDVEVWKNPDDYWQNGDVWGLRGPEFGMMRLVGTLAPRASLNEAQAQADATIAALAEEDSRYGRIGFGVTVHDLHDRLVADVRPMLWLLMGAVACVLLTACANVANLILVRTHGRSREVAVRMAMGASRVRVVRYALTESLLLAVVGAAAGVAVTALFLRSLGVFASADIPRLDAVALDGTVAAFAVVSALASTLLAGAIPGLAMTRADPSAALGNGRSSGAPGGRTRDALVVSQVALSLVLLVGAGLLVTSLARIHRVDPGFDPEHLLTFAVSIPGADYDWPEEAGRYYRAVQTAVSELPRVTSAGVVWPMPFSGSWSGDVTAGVGSQESIGVVPYYLSTEEYFPTARIPLVEGRLFGEGEARYSVLLTETVARRAFPGGSAVGRVVSANPWGRGMEEYRVIGVVGDIRQDDLRHPSDGGVYFDARGWSWVDWEVHVVVRSEVLPSTLVPTVRAAVAEIDPNVPVARPRPMMELIEAETATPRFILSLLGVFAGTALMLAVVGLYGVVAYAVGLRRKEYGIRMALGAAKGGIERMVVRRGLLVVGVGVLLGAVGAALLGEVLRAYLFEVQPGDPLTVVVASVLMAASAALASWVPARRAARTDPVEVLKAE